MSTGRQSWKTAGNTKHRNTRKLKIGLLSTLIAVLLGVIATLIMPLLQPPAKTWLVRLPVVLPQEKDGALQPYERLPNVAGFVSDQKIKQLFDEIAEPDENISVAEAIGDVKIDPLTGRDQVVIYCAQQALVTYDAELDVEFGWQTNTTSLRETLKKLQEFEAQVLLLLDLPSCQPGLATGELADDVCSVIRLLVDESGNDNLHVITSREEGQANPLHTVDDAQDRQLYDGTRLAHILEEHLTQIALDPADPVTGKKLLDKLQQQLESAQLLIGSQDALSNMKLPLRPASAAEETLSSNEENVAANSGADDAAAETSNEEDNPLVTWNNQWTDWNDTAVVHLEKDWLEFTRAIALAELSRRHGHEYFDDTAQAVYTELKQKWENQTEERPPRDNRELMDWMSVTDATMKASPAETTTAEESTSGNGGSQRLKRLLDMVQQDSFYAKDFGEQCPEQTQERVAFVEEWIAELNKGWDQQRLAQMQTVLARMRKNRIWTRNWPNQKWPHELVTIDYVLTRISADADIANVTQTLMNLLDEQQQICARACGHRSLDVDEADSRPVLKAVWDDQQDQLRQSQERLCEARKWLTLGQPGVDFAKQLLEEGCPDFAQQCHDGCCRLRMNSECFLKLQTQALQAARNPRKPSSDKLDQLRNLNGDLQGDQKDWPEESQKRASELFQLCAGVSHGNHTSGHVESHRHFLQTPGELLPTINEGRINAPEVFLGYFSAMLLEQKTGQNSVDSELLNQWKDVIGQLKDSGPNNELIIARTKLAQSLQEQWTEYFDDLSKQESERELSDEYVPPDAITEAGEPLIKNLVQSESASRKDQPPTPMDGTKVKLPVTTGQNDNGVYVFLSDDCPLEVVGEWQEANGYWVSSPEKLNDGLQLKTQKRLKKGTSVLVATTVTGADGIPRLLDYRRFPIQVDNSTQWKLEFLYTDKSVDPPNDRRFIVREDAGVFDWQLPPSTEHYAEYQDIKIRLHQSAGAATHVTVRAKFGADDWVNLLKKGKLNDGFVDILPPVSAEAGTPTATPPVWDIRDGFQFQVTPWNEDQELTEQTIQVQPDFQRPEAFVEVDPEWNESNGTLTLRVTQKDSQKLLPKQLDWSVHFNAQLKSLLKPDSDPRTADLVTDLSVTGDKEYNYKFAEIDDGINREFAVSVAGIPYCWWWKLPQKPATRVERLEQPFVRALLIPESSAENPSAEKDSAPEPEDPLYLLQNTGEDDESAVPFAVAVLANTPAQRFQQTELTVKYRRNNGRFSSFPLTDFSSTIRRSYRETARLSRSERGQWTLKTATELHRWAAREGQLTDQEGKHEVVTQLELPDRKVEDKHPPMIVVDRSPPEIRLTLNGDDLQQGQVIRSDTSSISGKLMVTVADVQSDIRDVQITWPGSKKPEPFQGRGPFEWQLTGLPPLKADELVPVEIEVTTTNAAGLKNTLSREWRYRYESGTGKLTFKWKNKPLQRELVLRRGSKSWGPLKRVSDVTFSDVPFAKGYLLQQGTRPVPGQQNINFTEDGQTIELD